MAASDTAFSVFSFLTFVLVCIPFSWHLEAWNTGTCLYMAWTALANLNLFINSIIWRGNTTNWAPVWCDISSKFMVGLYTALPAASLCINRRLYHMASIQAVTTSRADKRRGVIIDLCIGLGVPFLFMALHYIVQGHRFDIYEGYGCFPYVWNTPPAYFIIQAPILALALVSGYYSIRSIIAFKKRHVELKLLLSSNSSISPSRYFRLMCLAGTEVLLTIPVCLSGLLVSALYGDVEPWVSWEDTHFDFSRVGMYPAFLWRNNPGASKQLELTRWSVVAIGLLFFALFGFAQEAKRHYAMAYAAVTRRFGRMRNGTVLGSMNGSSEFKFRQGSPEMMSKENVLPVYVRKEVVRRRDSGDTFSSSMTTLRDVGGLLASEPSTSASSPEQRTNPTLPPHPPAAGKAEWDTEMPVLQDVGGFLEPQPQPQHTPPTRALGKTGHDTDVPELQDVGGLIKPSRPSLFQPQHVPREAAADKAEWDTDMPVLQDVGGFLQPQSPPPSPPPPTPPPKPRTMPQSQPQPSQYRLTAVPPLAGPSSAITTLPPADRDYLLIRASVSTASIYSMSTGEDHGGPPTAPLRSPESSVFTPSASFPCPQLPASLMSAGTMTTMTTTTVSFHPPPPSASLLLAPASPPSLPSSPFPPPPPPRLLPRPRQLAPFVAIVTPPPPPEGPRRPRPRHPPLPSTLPMRSFLDFSDMPLSPGLLAPDAAGRTARRGA